MVIKRLKLCNYRNYDSLLIEFKKKNTIFIGDNAQGKTNILESIYVLGLTKSYLNINEKKLIKFDNLYLKISGIVVNNNIEKNLEILINEKGKKVKVDNQEVVKLSNYISNLNVIIFSPDNIRILKESPSYRRKYLNMEISQLYNKYIKYLNDYNKILKQRNEYLKIISNNSNDKNVTYLEVLNDEFVDKAVLVFLYRKKFVDKVNERLEDVYRQLTGYVGLKMKYISSVEYIEDRDVMVNTFREKLDNNLKKDLFYKVSLLGPHRDDFVLCLDDKDILVYGSQGQNRCAILALKFAEVLIFKEVLGVSPILLLDDIFSELDSKRKNNIIKFIPEDVQTIITTTDLELIDEKILIDSDIYIVKDGKVTTN